MVNTLEAYLGIFLEVATDKCVQRLSRLSIATPFTNTTQFGVTTYITETYKLVIYDILYYIPSPTDNF